MGQGLRLIAVGYLPGAWTDEERLPDALQPMFLIALRDNIRPRAKETLAYFRDQGVDVKVISGDHPDTVAAVARQAGLERWRDVIDMTSVPADAPDSTFDDVAGLIHGVLSRHPQAEAPAGAGDAAGRASGRDDRRRRE